MSGMTDREKAFENMFAHDEEMKFRAVARRNKLFGLWAADLLGRADGAAYAKDVVAADSLTAGDDMVLRKVSGDLDAAHVRVSNEQLIAKLAELHAVATRQLFEE